MSKASLSKGWKVKSISRSGRPCTHQPWHDEVEWVKADAFNSAVYAPHLASVDHVVTTIGVLDYRGALTDPSIPRKIDKLGNTLYDAIKELAPTNTVQESPRLELYDKLNYEAAKCVADETAKHASIKSLVYVSAADGFPGIPQRYITTKRKAERYIDALPLRSIFFRPGFMFSDAKGFTKPLARLLGLSYAAQSAFSGAIPLLGAAGVKPLLVDRVGKAIIQACEDESCSGPIEVFQIEALADLRWRAEML